MQLDWSRKTRNEQPLSSRFPICPDGGCDLMRSDIESFDRKLRESITRFLVNLAVDMEVGSPSMASLSELKRCLLQPSQQVVQLILACGDDVFTNPDLFDFVSNYAKSCDLTLDICNALKQSVGSTRSDHFLIELAFCQFDEDSYRGRKEIYEATLRALKIFKARGGNNNNNNPIRVDYSELLELVCETQISWFLKFKDKKSKLDSKFQIGKKAWRALLNAIVRMTFASVIVCSVLAMPRLVGAVAEAASAAMPLGASMDDWVSSVWNKYEEEVIGQSEMMGSSCFWARIRKGNLGNIRALVDKWEIEMESILLNDGFDSRDGWINSMWSKYEKELDLQGEIMGKSYFWTPMGKGDLDDIRALVEKLEVEMESMLLNDGFASRDETAVMLAMDDLKKKLSEFMKAVKDLSDHAMDCFDDVIEWRLSFIDMRAIRRRNR